MFLGALLRRERARIHRRRRLAEAKRARGRKKYLLRAHRSPAGGTSTSRMNILFLNSSLTWGGTENWVLNAALQMADRGHVVTIGEKSKLFSERLTERGVTGSIRTRGFPLVNDADVVTVFALYRFLKRERIHVVVATKVRDYWLGSLACFFSRVPLVIRLVIMRSIEDKAKNRFV